jgi:hypothetical protein
MSSASHILEPRDRDLPWENGAQIARPCKLEWCDGVQLGVDRRVLKSGRSQYIKDLRDWLMLWGTLRSLRTLVVPTDVTHGIPPSNTTKLAPQS